MRCGLILALLAFVAVGCFGGSSASPPSSSGATTSSAPNPHGGASYAALCQHAPGCPPGGVPAMLRRPLRLPKLRPGAACPVSAPGRRVSRQFAPAIGGGPVYAVGLWAFDRRAVLPFPPHNHNFPPGSWTGQVLKWLISPAYHGPVLIRGRELNTTLDRIRRWRDSLRRDGSPPGLGLPRRSRLARLSRLCPPTSRGLLRPPGRWGHVHRTDRLSSRHSPPLSRRNLIVRRPAPKPPPQPTPLPNTLHGPVTSRLRRAPPVPLACGSLQGAHPLAPLLVGGEVGDGHH